MNVLLGVSGSVAAKLTSRLEKALDEAGHEIKVILTESSKYFEPASYIHPVYDDDDEWRDYKNKNTVLHIDLVKWADVFLIAPCTANTHRKIQLQLCDNLLTCCAMAWDYTKPMVIAPAMNTQMWNNLNKEWPTAKRPTYVLPQEKTLYCGDTGLGAMAEISEIVKTVGLSTVQPFLKEFSFRISTKM